MLKFIGSVMTIGGCWWIGFRISSRLHRRCASIAELISAIRFIKNEITFRLASLEEIMFRLKDNSGQFTKQFFEEICAQMSVNRDDGFEKNWNKSTDKLIWINSGDKELLYETARLLGKSNAENQAQGLQYIERRLESSLELAERERTEKSKLYRTLAIGTGAVAVLLVI